MKDISKKELYSLLEVVDGCGRSADIKSFEELLKCLPVILPYETSLYAIKNGGPSAIDRLINNDFPLDYLRAYFTENMIQDDPFVRKTLSILKPHFWNMENGGGTPLHKKFILFNLEFGLSRGLSCAFSDIDGKTTFLCLSNPMEKPYERHLRMVNFLAPHLHHTFARLQKPSTISEDVNPVLSRRETEAIKWVTEGKTNWEISKIMAISEATVKFHLVNIFRKLGAVNRGHAVAKAIQIAPHIFL